MPTPPPALPGSLLPQSHPQYAAHLFTNPLFPDCTIHTRTRTFHLHRCILAPRCEFFHSCFTSSFEEANTTSVTMHDDDPEVLERMLRWLYTLEFSSATQSSHKDRHGGNTSPSQFPWTADLDLWLAADKYGLTVLMEQCVDALLRTAEDISSEVEKASSAAVSRSAATSNTFQSTATDFVDMMSTLFTECPDREDVRDLQREMLVLTAPMIAKYMRSTPALQELVTSIPGFAVVLVETLSGADPEAPAYKNALGRRLSSDSGSSSRSRGSGAAGSSTSRSGSGSDSGRSVVKTYIPMNEDSEDEME